MQKGRLTALFNNQGWFWPNVLRHFWSLLWFGESMLPPATSGGNNVQVSLSIKELLKISIVLKLKKSQFPACISYSFLHSDFLYLGSFIYCHGLQIIYNNSKKNPFLFVRVTQDHLICFNDHKMMTTVTWYLKYFFSKVNFH